MFVLFCGRQFEYHPQSRDRRLLPILNTCLCLKLLLLFDAIYDPTIKLPFHLCSMPSKQPSILHFLFLRIQTFQSYIEHQLNHNWQGQAFHHRGLLRQVERSMIQIFLRVDVPSFEESICDHVGESLSFHWFIFFESVEIDFSFHSG